MTTELCIVVAVLLAVGPMAGFIFGARFAVSLLGLDFDEDGALYGDDIPEVYVPQPEPEGAESEGPAPELYAREPEPDNDALAALADLLASTQDLAALEAEGGEPSAAEAAADAPQGCSEAPQNGGGGGEPDEVKREKEPRPGVADIARAADAAGMSYGRYVQLTEPRRTQTPRPVPESEPPKTERTRVDGRKHRRSYTDEERAAAVQRATSGEYRTLREAAAAMGIPCPTVVKWVRDYKEAQG